MKINKKRVIRVLIISGVATAIILFIKKRKEEASAKGSGSTGGKKLAPGGRPHPDAVEEIEQIIQEN